MDNKQCSTCKQDKPITDFFISSASKWGYEYDCKECSRVKKIERKRLRELYRIHPELKPDPSKVTHKVCRGCKIDKSIEEFGMNKSKNPTLGGIMSRCRECLAAEQMERQFRLKMSKSDIANRIKSAQYRRNNPDKANTASRVSEMKRRGLDITKEQYISMKDRIYNGVCEICHRPNEHKNKALFIDHDHSNGKVRGLLCHKCNAALGHADDSIERLHSMVSYLIPHNQYRQSDTIPSDALMYLQ